MKSYLVDGSHKSLADNLLEISSHGDNCLVVSFGFGVLEIKKLLDGFEMVTLIADKSHSKLNPKAYETVSKMNLELENFSFTTTRTHAKLAILDNEMAVFTSANLSANRRIESYVVGRLEEFDGIDKIVKSLDFPDDILKPRGRRKKKKEKQLTLMELAKSLGVTGPRISQMVKDGIVTREGNGKFNLSSISDVVAWVRQNTAAKGKGDTYKLVEEEKHRKLKRENDLAELLVAPISDLVAALDKTSSQVIPLLDALPLEMKRLNPSLTGHDITLVKKTIAKCRNVIASTELEVDG